MSLAEGAPTTWFGVVICKFLSKKKFFNFSHEEAPVGRGHTFVSGNVSTRIHFITKRHLLLPTSQAHSAMASLATC